MFEIHRLTRQGVNHVTERLHHGAPLDVSSANALSECVATVEFDVEAAAGLVRETVGARTGTAVDQTLARTLPEAFPLPRRFAAEPMVWAWLASALLPDIVAARFAESARSSLRPRYVGRIKDNALARCWWVSALCADPECARKLMRTQYLADRVLDWGPARTPHVAQAVVDVFAGITDAVLISQTLKNVGFVGATLCLDGMTRVEVGELLRAEAINVGEQFATRTRLA